jgi:hypothetical protein
MQGTVIRNLGADKVHSLFKYYTAAHSEVPLSAKNAAERVYL